MAYLRFVWSPYLAAFWINPLPAANLSQHFGVLCIGQNKPGSVRMINVHVNSTSLRDAQRAGKTLFLGVSMRAVLEEISVWFSRLSEEIWAHQRGGHPPTRWNIKAKEGQILSLFELGHPSSPALSHQSSRVSAFRLRLNYTPGLPGSSACG